MHHKYAVRDGEAVWTGSTNWTDSSWTLQENVVLRVHSAELAAPFAANFEELWRHRDVSRSGHGSRARCAWVTSTAAPGSRPATVPSCHTGSRRPSAAHGGACASPRP